MAQWERRAKCYFIAKCVESIDLPPKSVMIWRKRIPDCKPFNMAVHEIISVCSKKICR